ncbi:MAG: hypothetical protein LBR26_09910 [Prevotella sp.]|jgi:hypothetical protein|nr:hypothetical protein [Prevotella sp.]
MATKQKVTVSGVEPGVSWQAISNQTWLKVTDIVSTADEDSFNVSVDVNASDSRAGIVTVIPSDNGSNGTVQVSQQGDSVAILNINPVSTTIPAAGGQFSLVVQCNTNWDTVYDVSVISLSPASGTGNGVINVTVLPNTGSDSRDLTVTVFTDSLMAQCEISQDAPAHSISVDPALLQPDGWGGSYNTYLDSDTSWNVQSKDEWLDTTPQYSGGSIDVMIHVEPNPSVMDSRSGQIVFQTADGSATATMTVDQMPHVPDVNIKNYRADAVRYVLMAAGYTPAGDYYGYSSVILQNGESNDHAWSGFSSDFPVNDTNANTIYRGVGDTVYAWTWADGDIWTELTSFVLASMAVQNVEIY